jgi:hypothetical protein
MSQALYFLQDLKMGHYMKVPVSYISIPIRGNIIDRYML